MQTEVSEVAIAETTSMDQVDLQVHTFGETISVSSVKVIQNPLSPVGEGFEEGLQGLQTAGFDLSDPIGQPGLGFWAIGRLIEPHPKSFLETERASNILRNKKGRGLFSDPAPMFGGAK